MPRKNFPNVRQSYGFVIATTLHCKADSRHRHNPYSRMKIIVSKPDIALKDAFDRMLDDYSRDPENGEFYALARRDFDAYVGSLHDEERGINLRPNYVPCSHRWLLISDEEIGGIVRVRHNVDTPFLASEAGHIGYDVPPSYRGQGYGTQCLKAGLDEARALGIEKVLLFADSDNEPSWRVIERCGGVLESESYSEHYKCPVRRYWIDVPAATGDAR